MISDSLEEKFANIKEDNLAFDDLVEYFNFYSAICLEYVADIISKKPSKKPSTVVISPFELLNGTKIKRKDDFF